MSCKGRERRGVWKNRKKNLARDSLIIGGKNCGFLNKMAPGGGEERGDVLKPLTSQTSAKKDRNRRSRETGTGKFKKKKGRKERKTSKELDGTSERPS